MKLKSDPRTNTEEQINTQHIEFTFCNLHYVKCNKLWNVYAGFFIVSVGLGSGGKRSVQELKLEETYVPDYISWQSNDFFPFFSSKMRRSVTDNKTHQTSASILSNAFQWYIYIYKSYQTMCCCRVAANSWSSDGMTIRCLALL